MQGDCVIKSIEGVDRYWGCDCHDGFSGLACSHFTCPAHCSWNGECLDKGVCACYPGYTGADCSQDCGCGGHGVCKADGSCQCDMGWRLGANGRCEWDCRCGGANELCCVVQSALNGLH